MMKRQPKNLQQLQEEANLTNSILGNVASNSAKNSSAYASKSKSYDSREYYYTNDTSFMREENYTINGDPVNKIGKKLL